MAGTYAAAGSFAAMTFAQGMIFAGSAINLAGNVTGTRVCKGLEQVLHSLVESVQLMMRLIQKCLVLQ